jgi:hypothetical protein
MRGKGDLICGELEPLDCFFRVCRKAFAFKQQRAELVLSAAVAFFRRAVFDIAGLW